MLSSFQKWWNEPFNTRGDVLQWALFVGLVLVLIALWGRVLGTFEAMAE
jgi:hypothetical protein